MSDSAGFYQRVELIEMGYRDFGLIFEELLPGNFARLQPPEGQDLTEGLEVKVRLGTVWKASLTELSGGQRSVSKYVLTKPSSNPQPIAPSSRCLSSCPSSNSSRHPCTSSTRSTPPSIYNIRSISDSSSEIDSRAANSSSSHSKKDCSPTQTCCSRRGLEMGPVSSKWVAEISDVVERRSWLMCAAYSGRKDGRRMRCMRIRRMRARWRRQRGSGSRVLLGGEHQSLCGDQVRGRFFFGNQSYSMYTISQLCRWPVIDQRNDVAHLTVAWHQLIRRPQTTGLTHL